MIDDHKFEFELLGILHGQKAELIPDLVPRIEVPPKNDLAEQFFEQVISARYNVFQLVGRRIKKENGVFVYEGQNSSHDYPTQLTEHIKGMVDWRIRERMDTRISRLGEFNSQERRKVWLSRPVTSKEPFNVQQIGNVLVVVDKDPGKGQRLTIFGAFSTESRSDYFGGRMNFDNGFMFYFPDNETGTQTINNFLAVVDTESKLHTPGTAANYNLFREIIFRIYPADSYVPVAVEKNMLREIEVHQIIDLR